jgi:hypothetical protein
MAGDAKLTRMCGGCSAGLPDGANFCPDCGAAAGSSQDSMGRMLAGFVSGAVEEIREVSRPVLTSPTGKKVAAGAAIGAVAAVAIPFVSIGVGALVGAGVAALRRGKSA